MVNLPPPNPSAWDLNVIGVLDSRDGIPTEVQLEDGSTLTVHNIAVGYDSGDEYAHIFTNCSPFVEGATLDLFFTDAVSAVIDIVSGTVLLANPSV